MRDMLGRLVTTLQLTRVSIAFGAVSDLWFTIVLVWTLTEWTPTMSIWWSHHRAMPLEHHDRVRIVSQRHRCGQS